MFFVIRLIVIIFLLSSALSATSPAPSSNSVPITSPIRHKDVPLRSLPPGLLRYRGTSFFSDLSYTRQHELHNLAGTGTDTLSGTSTNTRLHLHNSVISEKEGEQARSANESERTQEIRTLANNHGVTVLDYDVQMSSRVKNLDQLERTYSITALQCNQSQHTLHITYTSAYNVSSRANADAHADAESANADAESADAERNISKFEFSAGDIIYSSSKSSLMKASPSCLREAESADSRKGALSTAYIVGIEKVLMVTDSTMLMLTREASFVDIFPVMNLIIASPSSPSFTSSQHSQHQHQHQHQYQHQERLESSINIVSSTYFGGSVPVNAQYTSSNCTTLVAVNCSQHEAQCTLCEQGNKLHNDVSFSSQSLQYEIEIAYLNFNYDVSTGFLDMPDGFSAYFSSQFFVTVFGSFAIESSVDFDLSSSTKTPLFTNVMLASAGFSLLGIDLALNLNMDLNIKADVEIDAHAMFQSHTQVNRTYVIDASIGDTNSITIAEYPSAYSTPVSSLDVGGSASVTVSLNPIFKFNFADVLSLSLTADWFVQLLGRAHMNPPFNGVSSSSSSSYSSISRGCSQAHLIEYSLTTGVSNIAAQLTLDISVSLSMFGVNLGQSWSYSRTWGPYTIPGITIPLLDGCLMEVSNVTTSVVLELAKPVNLTEASNYTAFEYSVVTALANTLAVSRNRFRISVLPDISSVNAVNITIVSLYDSDDSSDVLNSSSSSAYLANEIQNQMNNASSYLRLHGFVMKTASLSDQTSSLVSFQLIIIICVVVLVLILLVVTTVYCARAKCCKQKQEDAIISRRNHHSQALPTSSLPIPSSIPTPLPPPLPVPLNQGDKLLLAGGNQYRYTAEPLPLRPDKNIEAGSGDTNTHLDEHEHEHELPPALPPFPLALRSFRAGTVTELKSAPSSSSSSLSSSSASLTTSSVNQSVSAESAPLVHRDSKPVLLSDQARFLNAESDHANANTTATATATATAIYGFKAVEKGQLSFRKGDQLLLYTPKQELTTSAWYLAELASTAGQGAQGKVPANRVLRNDNSPVPKTEKIVTFHSKLEL